MLLGFLALIAPCGGSFGLPKLISLFTGVAASAVVIVAAVTNPPAAGAANMARLENISCRSCRRMNLEQYGYLCRVLPIAIKLAVRVAREPCLLFRACFAIFEAGF